MLFLDRLLHSSTPGAPHEQAARIIGDFINSLESQPLPGGVVALIRQAAENYIHYGELPKGWAKSPPSGIIDEYGDPDAVPQRHRDDLDLI